jgi:hypothetical protein
MPDIKNHHWKIFSDISSPMFPIYSHIGIWFTHRNSPVSLCSSHNHLPKHAPPQDTLETWLTARPHPFGGDKKRKPLKKPMGEKHETHHPGHIVLFFKACMMLYVTYMYVINMSVYMPYMPA